MAKKPSVINSRALRFIKEAQGEVISELRDCRRVHRCGLRDAIAIIARLHRNARRSS